MANIDHKAYWSGVGHNVKSGLKSFIPWAIRGGLGLAGAAAGAYLGAHVGAPYVGAKLGGSLGALAAGTAGTWVGRTVGGAAGGAAGNYIGGKVSDSLFTHPHDPVAKAIKMQYRTTLAHQQRFNPYSTTKVRRSDFTSPLGVGHPRGMWD
jgi:hypothetical protein